VIQKKLNELEDALLKRFETMKTSVAANPVPNSPDYILTEIRRLKTVKLDPDEYIILGQLIAWCQSQGIISRDETKLSSTV
jgi:hypothetical protein